MRLRGEHRVQFFLKGARRADMRDALKAVLAGDAGGSTAITVDVDPLNVLVSEAADLADRPLPCHEIDQFRAEPARSTRMNIASAKAASHRRARSSGTCSSIVRGCRGPMRTSMAAISTVHTIHDSEMNDSPTRHARVPKLTMVL